MSIASEITRLQTAKADLKTAIEGKGVTVPSSATLDDYADLVDDIQTGGGGGGYFAEGTYTMVSGSRTFSVSVSFQPKFVYAFVSNWRELGHSSWRRAMIAGKMSGTYQSGELQSRYLNNSYSSTGTLPNAKAATYSNGTLTFDAGMGGTTGFPDGATIEWFAAGDGGAS